MKIKHLMSAVIEKITVERSRLHQNRFRGGAGSALEDTAILFEYKSSLRKLDALITNIENLEATENSLIALRDFLSERWEMIRSTNISYPYTTKNALAKICLELSAILSPIFHTNKFKLLMPTISVNNEVSLTNLDEDDLDAEENNEEKLQLHTFILSDNDTNIIDVFDCLSFAREDSILKHTHVLANNQKKLLSENEKNRIINHSLEAKEYYESIQQLHAVKVNGENIGAFVRRLIDRLKAGGERGGRDGTAQIAGQDAVQGIKEFYNLVKILDYDERVKLFSCFSTFNIIAMTFELSWMHLLSRAVLENKLQLPEEELGNIVELLSLNPTNSVPCVELISQDLERILNNHAELFVMFPKNKETSMHIALEICESRFIEAEENLIGSLNLGRNNVIIKYGAEGSSKLQNKIFKSLINDISDLKYIINESPPVLHVALLRDVLGQEYLQSLVKDVQDLQAIFNNFLDVAIHSMILNIIGTDYIRSIITDLDSLVAVTEVLCLSQYKSFLFDNLGRKHLINLIPGNKDLEIFLQSVPKILHHDITDFLNNPNAAIRLQNISSSSSSAATLGLFASIPHLNLNDVGADANANRPRII